LFFGVIIIKSGGKRTMKRFFLLLVLIILSTSNIFAFGKKDRDDERDIQKIEETGIAKIIIDINSNFNIKVTGAEDPKLFGEILSDNLKMFDIETEQSNNELRIKISSRSIPFFRKPDNNDIFLSVPVNTELELDTEQGLIIVDNCNGYKNISSETGDICIINSDGNIYVRNETGDITLGNIEGDIDGDSDTGDILLYNIKGKLYLKTNTGQLEGDMIEVTDDSEFLSDTGIINLDLVNSLSDFSYELSTDSGIIVLDTIQSTGKYQSNTGHIKFRADTDTGDILLK
jgi:hypothetical protein